jgi:hypothetical protein
MASSIWTQAKLARWRLHRQVVSRLGRTAPFLGRATRRVLFVTHNHRIAHSQIFPFFFYRQSLLDRYRVEIREIDAAAFNEGSHSPDPVELVCVQTTFDIESDSLKRLFERVHALLRPQRVAFLDWYAHSDLRLASALNPYIDVYVKKHLLKDRSCYGRTTRGDTLLTEYYSRMYDIDLPEVTFPLPPGFMNKVMIGPGFQTAPNLLPLLLKERRWVGDRDIDVHARLGVKGTNWYQKMREHAVHAVSGLRTVKAVWEGGLPKRRYMQELSRSKICFSPFGYGEVAWRDIEAIAQGALLLKPDMSHLESRPELFIPHETYVPVKWDFSDLEQQVNHYLGRPAERERIARNASRLLREYLENETFVAQMAPLFD